MRFSRTVSLIALLALATPSIAADEYVMMKVNGQDVTSTEIKQLVEGIFPEGQAPAFDSMKPEMRERLLRAMMAEKLVYGEAVKQGIDKSPKLLAEVEQLKNKLVVRQFLDAKSAGSITDADVKKEYDSKVAATKDEKQVRARHILVASEAEAKEAKKKIDGGKKFEDVVRDVSKDAGSAKQGGDLGFFTRDKMVKEFADAAFALKKGEISAPVKSAFGYHIIKVEEIGKVTPPAFNEVKDGIRAQLQEQKLNEYVASLVKSADVKVFDAKGKELPFDRNLPTMPEAAKPAKAE